MAIVDQKRPACRCPTRSRSPTGCRKERYFDPDFFALEAEQLWSAGVADGVPARGDPASPATSSSTRSSTSRSSCVRTDDGEVARLPERLPPPRRAGSSRAGAPARAGSPARSTAGATGPDGTNTRVPQQRTFAEHNLQPGDIDLVPGAVRDVGRLRVDQPRRRRPAAARVHRAGRHDPRRLEGRVAARRVVVRLPPPRELEARRSRRSMEQYHVRRGAPAAASIPGMRYRAKDARVRPAGVRRRRAPVPAHDERGHGRHGPRQRRAHRRGPARHRAARRRRRWRRATWNRTLNDAVVELAPRARATTIPDLNELEARGHERADGLLLPALLRAADVQQRLVLPLPAARAGGDADGDLVAHPVPRGRGAGRRRRRPRCGSATTPAGRRSPPQDFSNLPRQQRGLHAKGFEYMRLSEQAEGHIVNFERTIDGFLAGLPYERAAAGPAARST